MNDRTNGRNGQDHGFDHEKLEVYQLALVYIEHAHQVCKTMPIGSGSTRDEIGRAAESIVLNIPEGNAKPRGSKDRKNYFRRAAASAGESAAAWDVSRIRQYCSIRDAQAAREMLLSIYRMLKALLR